jgi:hypothetical protein
VLIGRVGEASVNQRDDLRTHISVDCALRSGLRLGLGLSHLRSIVIAVDVVMVAIIVVIVIITAIAIRRYFP